VTTVPSACARRASLFINDGAFEYDFGAQHPLQPVRLVALLDLIVELGITGQTERTESPAAASRAELRFAHSEAYIDAVERLSRLSEFSSRDVSRLSAAFGLGSGDTPAFRGMHEASAAIAGSTLSAVRAVLAGSVDHAFSPSGGLHHAMRDRASGFCIYNDLVVGIGAALRESEGRVLYLDFDAHHGDGVQAAFYDDPRVLTVSFHESGRYLFPGTGEVIENGEGAGLGYALNLPLAPFTQDVSWIEVIETIVPELCRRYRPTLIVSQHGCDGHAGDPLTHLSITCDAFAKATALVHRLSHEHCKGRWVAAGGGGYQPVVVVPRAWTALWGEMTTTPLPERLPQTWLDRWQPRSTAPIPDSFTDPAGTSPDVPQRTEIEDENRRTLETALELSRSVS
jgi:acetoin utilization protein AcuC